MKIRHALVAAVAALAAGQALACFTVYDRQNRILYNGMQPPVDMSRPLHETVPAKFPGGHLVNNNGGDCPRDSGGIGGSLRVSSETGRSPLLTDAASAAAMGLPATSVGHGAVVVRERPDSMRPGMVIAESISEAQATTTTMGAGPAPQPPRAVQPLTRPQPQR